MGLSFGGQSNLQEFFPGNTLQMYGGREGFPINLPLMHEPYPDPAEDWLPQPRNNPVWNVTDTLTWLKGRHTSTIGGMFRRTTMYEQIGGVDSNTFGQTTGNAIGARQIQFRAGFTF